MNKHPHLIFNVTMLLACLACAHGVTYKPLSQHPSEDPLDFQDYGTELIFENQVLPEDLEVAIYINRRQSRRFIFLIDHEKNFVSLTVTPCGQQLEWKLLRKNFRTYHDDDKPRYNQVTHTVDLPVTEASYIGKERRTFFKESVKVGLYVLELETREEDTTLRLYLSTKNKPSVLYPLLPDEEKIHVLKVRRDSAMVSWRSSPTSKLLKNNIQYCVVASEERNVNTLCEVVGENRRDLYHPSISFPRPNAASAKLLEPMQCFSKKTWHLFRNLKESRRYFFDVFVVNKITNASSIYKGATAVTKSKVIDVKRLKHNSMTTMSMNNTNSYTAALKVNVPKDQLRSWLFVQSCSGPGPVMVKLSKGNFSVFEARVMDYKTLELKNTSAGTYTLSISTSVRVNRTSKVWYSRKYHRFPFPSPPEDRRIKVFDTLTTCQSVTLSWKTSPHEKVRYCLYKRLTPSSVRTSTATQNNCMSKSTLETNQNRVLCRRYHKYSKHRFDDVIMQEVTGLRPSRTYVFDVFVAKVRGKALPYDSVWVTTSQNCSRNQSSTKV